MEMLQKRIEAIDRKLASKEVEVECAYKEYRTSKKKAIDLKREEKDAQEALRILRKAGQGIKLKLFRRLSDTVTYALKDIFGEDTYKFVVKSRFTGKKVSIDFLLKKGRREYDPLESVGHGVADVISFALRVALISMKPYPKRAVLLLDEPFRNVSAEYRYKVGQFLRKVCTETGLQIIMCTHVEEYIDAADRVFVIRKNAKNRTIVRMIEKDKITPTDIQEKP